MDKKSPHRAFWAQRHIDFSEKKGSLLQCCLRSFPSLKQRLKL